MIAWLFVLFVWLLCLLVLFVCLFVSCRCLCFVFCFVCLCVCLFCLLACVFVIYDLILHLVPNMRALLDRALREIASVYLDDSEAHGMRITTRCE